MNTRRHGRRTPAQPSLATRIQTDPVYQAVIRLAGYLGIAYPLSQDDAARMDQQLGRDKVMAAAEELLDFDAAAHIARLKPGVRRLCSALIGPSPEEWDNFYGGIENPPPNPYRKGTGAAHASTGAVREETVQGGSVEPAGNGHARPAL